MRNSLYASFVVKVFIEFSLEQELGMTSGDWLYFKGKFLLFTGMLHLIYFTECPSPDFFDYFEILKDNLT